MPLMKRYSAKVEENALFLYDFYNPQQPLFALPLNEVDYLQPTDKQVHDLPHSFELVLKHMIHDHFHYQDDLVNYVSEYRFGVPTNMILWENCPNALQKGNMIYKRPIFQSNSVKKIHLQQGPMPMSFVIIADSKELYQKWWLKLSRHVAVSKIVE
eukprot:NODE_691_length_4696_cov_0.623885.p4 type:complete len:156 gc:universal NODE_691_length_4696_cov_0.623885:2316-1849(-)